MKFYYRWLWIALIGIFPLLISAADAANREPHVPLSPGLAKALTNSLQENLPAAYQPKSEAGKIQAVNPAHSMDLDFAATGPHARDVKGAWTWGMSLVQFGREGDLEPVPAANVVCDKGRVEYRRGPNLTEWYLNTALGVEQGFTIAQKPAISGSFFSHLVLGIRLSGNMIITRETGIFCKTATETPDSLQGPTMRWADMNQTATLTSSDGVDKSLGYAVGVSLDTVVAGAPKDDDVASMADRGSAYVYTKTAGGWTDMSQTAKLTASDGEAGDEFGYSVGISGDTIVVGAWHADYEHISNAGGAYLFDKLAHIPWADSTETVRLRPYAQGVSAQFGNAVAISYDTVVVGAWLRDANAMVNSGTASYNETRRLENTKALILNQ